MAAELPHRVYANLARERLHPRLARLFAKYPSPALQTAVAILSQTASRPPASNLATENQFDNGNAIETKAPGSQSSALTKKYISPFLPFHNPITKKVQGPVYSLRRQADLVKIARSQGIEDLLHESTKSPAFKARKRQSEGLRVKGTGEGQRPKGKKWERTMEGRLEERRQAMMRMPRMIEAWKRRGHGRNWSKWPK